MACRGGADTPGGDDSGTTGAELGVAGRLVNESLVGSARIPCCEGLTEELDRHMSTGLARLDARMEATERQPARRTALAPASSPCAADLPAWPCGVTQGGQESGAGQKKQQKKVRW